MLYQRPVNGKNLGGITFGLHDDRADERFVDSQTKQRIVQLPKCTQGPELIAGGGDFAGQSMVAALRAPESSRSRRDAADRDRAARANNEDRSSAISGVKGRSRTPGPAAGRPTPCQLLARVASRAL